MANIKPSKSEPVELSRGKVKLERIFADAWYARSSSGLVIVGFTLENSRVDQWVHFNVTASLQPAARGFFEEDDQYPQERVWKFPPPEDAEAGKIGPGKHLRIQRSLTKPTGKVGNPRLGCLVKVSATFDDESPYSGALDLSIPPQ